MAEIGISLGINAGSQGVPNWVLNNAALDMYFSQGTYFSATGSPVVTQLLTTTRASTGYAATSSGLLVPFLSNIPRIADLGLLVEQAATNNFLHSQSFENITLAKASITQAATTAPDATTTGEKLVEDNTSGVHEVNAGYATVSASQTFTLYAKAAERSWLYIQLGDGTNGSAYFNISTGALGTVFGTTTATITAAGNGWYRIRISCASVTTNVSSSIILASANGTVSYAGDGTSGAYIWGAQVETSTFPTSYIPTTTVAVTRAIDNEAAVAALLTALQSASGTVIMSVGGGIAAAVGTILGINGLIGMGKTAADNLTTAFGGAQTSGNSATWTGNVKVGLRWTPTAVAICLNGGTIVTAANTPPSVTSANIGSTSGSSAAVNQFIKRLTVFTSSVSDTAFQALTT